MEQSSEEQSLGVRGTKAPAFYTHSSGETSISSDESPASEAYSEKHEAIRFLKCKTYSLRAKPRPIWKVQESFI